MSSEYDIYLNGTGYMLAKRPDGQLQSGAAQERKTNPFARYLNTDEQFARVPFRFGDGGGLAEYDGSYRYAYGDCVDTRSGAVVAGAKFNMVSPGPAIAWPFDENDVLGDNLIDSSGAQMGIGARFDTTTAHVLRTARVLVRRDPNGNYSTAADFTVAIYDNSSGKPGSPLANGSVTVSLKEDPDSFLPWPDRWRAGDYFWLEVVFPGDVSLAASTTYWFVVLNNAAPNLYWGHDLSGGVSFPRSVYNGSSWGTASNSYPLYYAMKDKTRVDSYPRCFCEFKGVDANRRLYFGVGYKVMYYTGMSGGYVGVSDSKVLSAPVLDLKVFNSLMFAAQGPNDDIWYTDGTTATANWTQLTGQQANALAIHDSMLWKADIASLIGSTDGTTWTGAACTVGDPGTPVQAMVSHGGKLFCAKPEGIYEITYPSDYPGTTAPVANLMLDFSTELAPRTWMLDWHGGLYFPGYGGVYELKSGILRNVWAEKIDEGAQDLAVATDSGRPYYKAKAWTRPRRWPPLYDAHPGGWAAAIGTTRGLYAIHCDPFLQRTGLWCYDGRNWHDLGPIDSWGAVESGDNHRAGEYALALHLEDVGGGRGRLWFGEGHNLGYFAWPTWTNDRWADQDSEYSTSGVGVNTNVVCPKFSIDHRSTPLQFCKVGVVGQRGQTGNQVKIYYKLDAATDWTIVGTATLLDDQYDEIDFPANTTGRSIALMATLFTASGNNKCARLEQLDLLYQPIPEAFTTYQVIVHAAPDLALRGGGVDPRSTNEILDDLRPLAGSSGFTYIDPSGSSHTVRVTGLSIQHMRQEVAPGATLPTEAYAILSLLDV